MNSIWIVEMWDDIRCRWEPTIGSALTRKDGRIKLDDWRKANPGSKFRLVMYYKFGYR